MRHASAGQTLVGRLLFCNNTMMLFGDAKQMTEEIVKAL
jgi:NAD/NADP transhydrogenase beta subunit